MSMLDDMKTVLRVSNPAFDVEVEMLIEAAKADMVRVGIEPAHIDSDDPLVKMAVACYCKSRFGFDEPHAEQYEAAYRQTVADMLNSSSYNIAAEAGE